MVKDKAQLELICENFIKHVTDFYDIPGLAVGVCCGDLTFTGALGCRNRVTKEPVLEDTVFHCTSVSKLFTAAGIMMLIDAGKLALDDKLCDVLPWMSIADKRWENITIKTMLCHTSGLTDVSDYCWEKHETDEDSLRRYALSSEVADRKLLWDPSEGKFRYSSLAYNLLGLVITEVSGKSFEDFIAEKIFEPMGMNDSTFKTYERIDYERTDGDLTLEALDKAELAMPHSKAKDRNIILEENYPYTRQHAPSSTLTATAGDLLKWARGCMGNKAMWQEKVTVPDTGEKMGLGWFIREVKGADGNTYTLMGHEGSDDGFRTSFWICPEEQIGIVLLCNLTDAPLKKLSNRLLSKLI